MEGNSRDNITFTGNAKKVGFETVIPLTTDAAFVVANALAADGTILGTTDVWDMELGAMVSNWTPIPLPSPLFSPAFSPSLLIS